MKMHEEQKTKIDAVVTGATGLIGRWLVPLLTARGRQVAVLIRHAAERASDYSAWVDAHGGDASLLHFFEADLALPGLGLTDEARVRLEEEPEDFFHLGAAMQFGLELDHARKVNVEGTRELLEIAQRAHAQKRLRRFVHVGGFKLGTTEHRDLDKLGGYERTKIEADAVVREFERRAGMPVTRVQPGAIIGDSRTGETTQFWGFADLVRDIFNGKLPAIVGGAGYWMPLVTVDHVASFIAAVPELDDEAESEYLLLDDESPDLDELVERITRHLGVNPVRRVVSKGALELFLRMGGERLTGVSPEAVSFIGPERYDIDATKRAAVERPDLDRAILRSVDFFVATHFGKNLAAAAAAGRHHGRMRRVAGIPTYVESSSSTSPSIVLLHGIPLDASSWNGVVDALPKDLQQQTARADLPGLGRTTKSLNPQTSITDWMESLLAGHSKNGKPWLVGHSLGTRYVVEHAAKHPNRVAGVVLVSPYFLQSPPPFFLRFGPTASLAMSLMRESDLEKLVGKDSIAIPRILLSRPGARTRIAKALVEANTVREDLQAKLRALSVPAIIIVGERDPLIVSDLGPSVTRVITIPNAGHNPQLDAPEAIAKAIARTLHSASTLPFRAKRRASSSSLNVATAIS